MVLDERARHELFLRLEQVLGPESAETLMEMMPPVGWADVATKRDLDALEQRMDLRFELVDQRFDAVDQRFESLEQRLDQRFEASEGKLLAAFRGELLAQSNVITAQTRTLVMANFGAVLSVAVLAFGAARLT
ncbi:MAG: hypothetical protein QOF96_3365 [Actinomycetota bacterium]|nr:hypothetical protein [Actinomycetota bacterium]